MNYRRHLALFALSAAAGLVCAAAPAVHAYWVKQHASFCSAQWSVNSWTLYNGGFENSDPVNQMGLLCPVADDSQHPKSAVAAINVHVRDGNSTSLMWAEACVTFRTTPGGSCGDADWTTDNSFVGYDTLTPPPDVWADHPDDYGYIFVLVPVAAEGRGSPYLTSAVLGYELQD